MFAKGTTWYDALNRAIEQKQCWGRQCELTLQPLSLTSFRTPSMKSRKTFRGSSFIAARNFCTV